MGGGSDGGVAAGVCMIMIGCCINFITLEFITASAPGTGWLISFLHFALVVAVGCTSYVCAAAARGPFLVPDRAAVSFVRLRVGWFPVTLVPTVLPLWWYCLLALLFGVLSVLNLIALDYRVSMPVHTVFRSSSLAASLLVGRYGGFKKRYTPVQVWSCVAISVGIAMVTLADARQLQARAATATTGCCGSNIAVGASANDSGDGSGVERWYIGIAMLAIALMMSALLGHLQEYSFARWGRQPDELMFYTNLLSIPGSILALWWNAASGESDPSSTSVGAVWLRWWHAAPVLIRSPFDAGDGVYPISVVWLLALNVASQYVCLRGVLVLTSATSILTTTVAITLRKFVSLIISVYYFQHTFTPVQWLGSFITFAGGYAYAFSPRAVESPPPSPPATTDSVKLKNA